MQSDPDAEQLALPNQQRLQRRRGKLPMEIPCCFAALKTGEACRTLRGAFGKWN
jgi:hypothetical protein